MFLVFEVDRVASHFVVAKLRVDAGGCVVSFDARSMQRLAVPGRYALLLAHVDHGDVPVFEVTQVCHRLEIRLLEHGLGGAVDS